jgi:hypothetical protein
MTDVGMLSTVLRAALNELRDSKDDALAAIEQVADQLQLAPSHRPSTCLAGLPTERRRSCSIGRPVGAAASSAVHRQLCTPLIRTVPAPMGNGALSAPRTRPRTA